MQAIKDTVFYSEVIKEFNFHFGNFYFFDGFIVSEIKTGVDFSWEHARQVIHKVTEFYKTSGSDIIYISNRINEYNVKPADWLKFTMYTFKLKAYGIVANTTIKRRNAKLESLFIPTKFRTFNDVFEAIQWAAQLNDARKQPADKEDAS
ncbi:hypothetical protein [Nonlabens xiamenensis]|uniref:hypothetical protein n=1 Tax=Nonlabens xiamenensis TaxID=2341043 RepID=UPI000F60ACEF|nr:hypothetical protein [Nonlabens xiamenensis]